MVEGDIFIYSYPRSSILNLYKHLREVDFVNAVQRDSFDIGLNAIAAMLSDLLKYKPPDVIYLETSLFPERTRSVESMVDFLLVKINSQDEKRHNQILCNINRAYQLVYEALHKTHNTVYFVPQFFLKPSEMRMVFTEFQRGYDFAYEDVKKSRVQEKKQQIARKIETAIKKGGFIKQRHDFTPIENSGTYMKRSPLSRTLGRREQRGERNEELTLNARIFHSFFHQYAFPDYAKSFLWCIPIIGAATNRQGHLVGQGALFIVVAYSSSQITFTQEEATRTARLICYLTKDLFSSYLYVSAKDMLNVSLQHALRSAIAAIMARNISHNIGSHGLAYFIAEIEEKIRNRKLDVDERLLKSFLEYTKARMDFVAEISTYWKEMPWLEQLTL